MKSEEYKSLEEVWDMKETVWQDFQKSGFSNYADFIENEMIEIRKKYSFILPVKMKQKPLIIV